MTPAPSMFKTPPAQKSKKKLNKTKSTPRRNTVSATEKKLEQIRETSSPEPSTSSKSVIKLNKQTKKAQAYSLVFDKKRDNLRPLPPKNYDESEISESSDLETTLTEKDNSPSIFQSINLPKYLESLEPQKSDNSNLSSLNIQSLRNSPFEKFSS